MNNNIFEKCSSITSSIIAIILGCLFLFRNESLYLLINILLIIFFISLNLNHLFKIIKDKKHILNNLISLLIDLFFLLLIILFFTQISYLINMIMGTWLLLRCIIHFIDSYRCKIDMIHGTLNNSLKGLIDLILGISLVFQPDGKAWFVCLIVGLYLIIWGLFDTISKLRMYLPTSLNKFYKRHTSVSLPVLIDALIPLGFYFSAKSFYESNNLQYSNNPSVDEPIDLEIHIYLKQNGHEALGHVDISFNGLIYSYGCHDAHHRHLHGTFGDGVLIIAHRDRFIKNAINENRMVISYGIKLNDKEKEIIQKRIDELCQRTIPWDCDAKIAMDKGEDASNINDYPSRVYKATNAMMYKFSKGRFKTYFVLSTNCVLLSDYLIRTPDLNLINLSGIVIPGSYLKFLNEEYLNHTNLVTRRLVYKK